MRRGSITPTNWDHVVMAATDVIHDGHGVPVERHVAVDEFVDVFDAADRDGLAWPAQFAREAVRVAAAELIREQQKTLKVLVGQRSRPRPVTRGTKTTRGDGSVAWVQQSMLAWDGERFRDAIRDETARARESRTTLAMYRACLDAIERTEAGCLTDALQALGCSLDELLKDVS